MAPRPASWGQLTQQATEKQLQSSQPKASEAYPQEAPQSTLTTAQPRDLPSKPNAKSKATKTDQANGVKAKGKDENAEGIANVQKRPAWGAAQPPSNAAKVAEARTFKVRTHNTATNLLGRQRL